jgi:hypothetical protein
MPPLKYILFGPLLFPRKFLALRMDLGYGAGFVKLTCTPLMYIIEVPEPSGSRVQATWFHTF